MPEASNAGITKVVLTDGLGVAYDLTGNGGTPVRQNVGINLWAGFQIAGGPGAGTVRSRHDVQVDCSDLRLVYTNFATLNPAVSGVDTDGTVSLPIKASIESSGVIYRVTFDGATGITIDPGGTVISDPVGLEFAAGTQVFVRTYVNATGYVANGVVFGGAGGRTATTDLTAPGSAAIADSTTFVYQPSAVLATPKARSVSIAVFGDSIGCGSHDAGDGSTGDHAGYAFAAGTGLGGGYISRGLFATRMAYMNSCHPSEQGATFILQANHFRRLALFNVIGATHAIDQMGINDITNSLTLAQMQALKLSEWSLMTRRSMKVIQTTITPTTTSTDSWATTANQSIASPAKELVRTGLNDWIRAGAPITNGVAVAIGTSGALLAGSSGHPLTGYLEIADLAETSRNSGIWRAGYTDDGLHPINTGAAFLAAGVTASAFTL